MKSYAGYVLIALLAASHVLAQEWSIDVAPARKRLVSRNELVLYCRSDREIDGCTEFLGETLTCECRLSGQAWSMTAHAQFMPYMYLLRPVVEEHEEKHIDDLREQVRQYFVDLTVRRFADGESCRSAAEFEMTVFNLRMDLFRRLSNLRLR